MKFMTTKNELRSSKELLSAFQKSEGRGPYVEEGRSNSIKEICAPHGNRENLCTQSR